MKLSEFQNLKIGDVVYCNNTLGKTCQYIVVDLIDDFGIGLMSNFSGGEIAEKTVSAGNFLLRYSLLKADDSCDNHFRSGELRDKTLFRLEKLYNIVHDLE